MPSARVWKRLAGNFLYVWSLHPRAGKPEGRITQATGCLLPAGCRTEGLAEQLSP
jgi:type VI secretion system protein ImpL